jgi:hypothetical protein
MSDKEIINEFTKLYSDYGSIDNALVEIRKIISMQAYERLYNGIMEVRE